MAAGRVDASIRRRPASVHPSDAIDARNAAPGSVPSSSAAANAPTRSAKTPSGSRRGDSKTTTSVGQAVRHVPGRRRRRGSCERRPSAPRRPRPRRSGRRRARPAPRPRNPSGSAARAPRPRPRGRGRRRRAPAGRPRGLRVVELVVDVGRGGSSGVAPRASRSNATWPTPPRARSRTTPSAVGSSPVLPTSWTVGPPRAAASATRDDMPPAAMAPSSSRPLGDPMTTITR